MTWVQGSAHADAVIEERDLTERMHAAAADMKEVERLMLERAKVAQRRREVAGFQT